MMVVKANVSDLPRHFSGAKRMNRHSDSMLDTAIAVSLVIGADGLIGHALLADLTFKGLPAIGSTRRTPSKSHSQLLIDLTAPPSQWRLPQHVGVAYLCAGIASLEQCRQHPHASAAINCTATITLANALADRGASVIYLSSNQVFDGRVAHRQVSATTCPITEYGRQKARTEEAILQLGKQGMVVRLTKVMGSGNALLESWREDLKAGNAIHPFEDMRMSPVSVDYVVDALTRLGRLSKASATATASSDSLVQISATRDVTYAQAALHVAKKLGVDKALIQPISARTANIDITATPSHTTMDTTVLTKLTGLLPPDPYETLDCVMGLS